MLTKMKNDQCKNVFFVVVVGCGGIVGVAVAATTDIARIFVVYAAVVASTSCDAAAGVVIVTVVVAVATNDVAVIVIVGRGVGDVDVAVCSNAKKNCTGNPY